MIVAKNTPVTVNRSERVLTYMIASAIGLSILAIVAVIIARASGVDVLSGVWLTVAVLPRIGLPVGVVLIIVRIVLVVIKRSRAAKDATN